jgi:hypothetical protein
MNIYFRAGLKNNADHVSPCNHKGDHLKEDHEDWTVWCRTCKAWFIVPIPHTEMQHG